MRRQECASQPVSTVTIRFISGACWKRSRGCAAGRRHTLRGHHRFSRRRQFVRGFSTPFSAHTAPSLHAHAACALPSAINVEYFFDHYRIEQMFFDGALVPSGGMLCPDSSRPGFGLECKLPDMEKYKVYGNATA